MHKYLHKIKIWMKCLRTDIKKLTNEEKANTLTHFFSLLLSLVVAWPLLRLAMNAGKSALAGTVLFVIGMILMFGFSTLYHFATTPVCKSRLRIMDHISIYVMIAGSYSPICLYVLDGWLGWALFVFLWVCVIAGSVSKFVALGRYPHLSLALYLAMGWVALFVTKSLWLGMPHSAFLWILAEGVFYTVGAYFFHYDEQHPYWHTIWHVFITLGAASHTIATWLILK